MVISGNEYDNILESLRSEFLDEANEVLNEIDIILENMRSGQVGSKEGVDELFRRAHSLKGSSGIARYTTISLTMHSMEDYLSKITEFDPKYPEQLQIFSDRARDFVTGDAPNISGPELARTLPNHAELLDQSEKSGHNITALLVVNDKISGKIFEQEFAKHGLRVLSAGESFEAIEIAAHIKPDFIVISGVLDLLSGVDVACALTSMPTTSSIPVCVMTSFDRGHPDLKGLPEEIPLIQKSNLSEDLEAALKKVGLH